ncbi:MAG: FecR domain-containing protein [Verrucomicrobiota bacterium]
MSDSPFNPDRLEELLLASADESFSNTEREELNTLLRDEPAARTYATRTLALDATLADHLGADAMEQRYAAEDPAPVSKIFPFPSSKRTLIAAAAIFIVLAVGLPFLTHTPPAGTPIAATIQSTNRTTGFTVGDHVRPGDPVRFESGRIAIKFQSGAKLAVEGPTEIFITGDNGAKMTRGRATIRVPGKIKGFTLDTPSEQVVDLGTSFGVNVEESGATSIAVFEGEVELRGEQHSSAPKRLLAGASVRVADKSRLPSKIPYQIDDYLNTWQHSFGIDAIEGDLRIAAPGERQNPGTVVDDNHLLLFPENESIVLPAGFPLSTTEPGIFNNEQKPRLAKQEVTLSAPVTVDSHLLQFNPGANDTGKQTRRFKGHLRFDRPVVGLLLSKNLLDASDELLALPSTNFENLFRRGINKGDQIELAPDRRTLHLSLDIQDGIDQIRVLVASEHDHN